MTRASLSELETFRESAMKGIQTFTRRPWGKLRLNKNMKEVKLENRCSSIRAFKLLSSATSRFEKQFLITLLSAALFTTIYHIYWESWYLGEFNTRTTVGNLYHEYANVYFPAITVCDTNRIDWNKKETSDLLDFSVEDRNDELQNLTYHEFRRLLALLSVLNFGSSRLTSLRHISRISTVFNSMSIDIILRKLNRQCEDMFVGKCWWRNRYYNCCDLFELQKTGMGYCYSFNSDISEQSKDRSPQILNARNYWTDWNGEKRPRKTSGSGDWSGLRFTISVQKSPTFAVEGTYVGVVMTITDPQAFPMVNELFIPEGKFASIGLSGYLIQPSEALRSIPQERRRCLFPEEKLVLLKGYLENNCVADCYRRYMINQCQCSINFMYFHIKNKRRKAPPCTVKALKCLVDYNSAFDWHFVYTPSRIGNKLCECPADCISQKYSAELDISTSLPNDSIHHVESDIHFERSYCTLYKTERAYDFLDVLVTVGNLITLFLGASIVSIVEIILYIILKVRYYVKMFRIKKNKVHTKWG